MAISVSFTVAQAQFVQRLLKDVVDAEAKTQNSNSGDLANTPTFQEGELSVAEGALAAVQAGI